MREVSIHSPRRSEGRRTSSTVSRLMREVSIHSPRRSEGRRRLLWDDALMSTFQSTPPAEARGDDHFRTPRRGADRFNPLPPPKRGETSPPSSSTFQVSIHSPRRSEGRLGGGRPHAHREQVSIHSPRRSEGRRRCRASWRGQRCFNPLPPPKRGETTAPAVERRASEVSIHSPRRSEGRRWSNFLWRQGRRFQSTPPAEARGDDTARCRSSPNTKEVSIHSPRRSEGRHYRAAWSAKGWSCFNPLPPPKRGETSMHA